MFKPFYIHINFNRPGPITGRFYRAATCYISPIEGDDKNVNLRVAVCSKKDQFEKAIGRAVASASGEVNVINKRDLPKTLSRIAEQTGYKWADYNYVLRNFM